MGTPSLDEAIAATIREKPAKLKVDQFLRDLDDHPDINRLVDMLNDPRTFDHNRMAAIMSTLRGQEISEKAIARWRKDHSV